MKPRHFNRFLAAAVKTIAAVAFFTPSSQAADVTLTGKTAIENMNTDYTVDSPDTLILDFTGVGGNRSTDTMGAAIAKSGANLTIAGNGTLRVTGNSTDVLGIGNVWGGGRVVNISLGSGGLIDIQGGAFVNGGWGGGTWTNNLADMNIASGAVFDFWDGGIRVDALTGAGSLQNGSNSSTVHSLVVGVDGGSGTFSGVIGGGTNRAGHNKISLTKEGVGTQILSGNLTYTGTTTVKNGVLTIDGSLANATMAISGGTVDGTGTLTTKIAGSIFDKITMTGGTLTATGLTLNISPGGAGLTQTEYVLVDATAGGTISGTFAGLTGAPGYVLDYGTPNQVKLVVSVGSPYDTWSSTSFANPPFTDNAPTSDPDGDGLTNQQEFAFGLDPTTGESANPITVPLDKTAGTFSYTKYADSGLTYTVWTSPDLQTWTKDDAATQNSGTPNAARVATVAVTLAPTGAKWFVRIAAE